MVIIVHINDYCAYGKKNYTSKTQVCISVKLMLDLKNKEILKKKKHVKS